MKKILLTDDDAAARRMMRRVLERRGYSVVEAGDGESGLALAREEKPWAILLDLRMPGTMSGFDVAREVRADPAISDIPIIVVSASAHTNVREVIAEIGCNAFVEKPVDFDELDEVLRGIEG